ncbi:MAG: thiamine-phosphate kinase [Bacteroidales bacterium]|nr:thiamine-phosphate kinase [Bacteroidales bacterium]
MENATKTPLSEYGEFGLIDLLTKNIQLKNPSTILGVGDDAAIIQAGDRQQLVSKDLLIEGVHFDIRYYPLKHLGYKAIAVNLSDIAAMNAKPEQILVGIAASSRYTVEALEEIYAGMYLCCEHYGVDLVGGDTTSSLSGLCISITVLGYAKAEKIVRRSTAQTNDLICVSGDLGGAYMGLMVLEREKEVFLKDPKAQPDLEGFDYILQRQLKPSPRFDIVDLLEENNILPTAMIDISDGLASEILHICKQSHKGCTLYEDKIPIDIQTNDTAMDFSLIPTTIALNGGEDYELLFTVKQSDYEKIKTIKDISVIGHMNDEKEGCYLITNDKKSIPLKAQGWDAYIKRP